MNWKLVVIGGLAFYAVMFVLGFVTGPLIHNTILQEPYRAHEQFWRPELNQDPPDMAALMPMWITTGVITSLILAAIYGWIRPAFRGPGWKKGLSFGFLVAVIICCMMLAWSGVFNLSATIWLWWGVDTFIAHLAGGAVLGFVGQKLAPE